MYRRHKKDGKTTKLVHIIDSTKAVLKSKKRISSGLAAIVLLISAGTLTTLIKNGVQAIDTEEDNNTQESSEASETESLAIVEDGELVVELGDTPVFAYIPTTITVEEEMPAGYTLKAYSENPTLSSDGAEKPSP